MKKTKSFIALMAIAVCALALTGLTAEWRVLDTAEQMRHGANRVWELTHADLTTAATNTAQSINAAVPANTMVRLIKMELPESFDIGLSNTNHTGALTLRVGDGSTTDLFLSDTELAEDGTTIWKKYGSTVVNSGTSTNVTLVLGQKVYTTTGNIVARFTPNTEDAVADNTTGRVRLFFKLD